MRPAQTRDVRGIRELLEPFVQRRILLGKDLVVLYESVQQFLVAEDEDGAPDRLRRAARDVGGPRRDAHAHRRSTSGCTTASGRAHRRGARGRAPARSGSSRLFCLTFEVDFFTRRGFAPIGEQVVDPDVYSQLMRSPDEGVAEFLDLAHVKPNTLGNTRMLKQL